MPNTDNQPITDPLSKFDHVVVLMLENRSFDNLLGNLYSPGELQQGQQFAGLQFGGPYFNIIPDTATDGHAGEKLPTSRVTKYSKAPDIYFQPYPDPGEKYPQVNTQLFDTFNPPSNENKGDGDTIAPPYNLPPKTGLQNIMMQGFIKDYLSILRSYQLKGFKGFLWKLIYKLFKVNPPFFKLNDKFEDYSVIMQCYENDQVPVLTTLAKDFAVFDHWHCDVPSQTYTNRAFWHSASSFGFVNNSPLKKWLETKGSPTLFNLMTEHMPEKEKSWKVYTDNIISLTALIHFQQLADNFLTGNFKSLNDFLNDAKNGALPAYSFLEPRFFTPHNDQHPSNYDSLDPVDNPGPVGSVLLGEKLIYDVYNAVKSSKGDKNKQGNTWKNTLLIITHDEHGGCYDHVAPGPAPVPIPGAPCGEEDFCFDRVGIRVPMIMVSAYIKPNTIINTELRHTSFLNTMSEKWKLPHLTDRDKSATPFTSVFNTDTARDADTWTVLPEPVIPGEHANYDFSNTPIGDLEKNILKTVSQWKTGSIADGDKINTAKEAMDYLVNLADELPGADPEDLLHQGDWFKSLLKK